MDVVAGRIGRGAADGRHAVKIAIVGAGPAGSFCAFKLARAGGDVTLFDRHPESWEKPCGGGVPPKVRERFAEIERYDGDKQIVAVGNFISPGGTEVTTTGGRALWVVARKQFDGYIRALALDAGAKFVGERIKRVEKDNGRFKLYGKRMRKFDYVVGADGALSVVRRDLLKPIPKKFICMTVGYFLDVDADEAVTWFLPKPGYIWSFPRSDHVCLGGGTIEADVAMWPLIDEKKQSHYADAKIRQKWAAPIPSISDPAYFDMRVTGPNFAVVGDAAGHVDSLSGEGILYALWGGALLAQAILEGKPDRFEQSWRDEFGHELRKASELFWKVYNPRTMEWVIRIAARSQSMREFFRYIMTEQPSYRVAGANLKRRLPTIALEVLKSLP